MKLVKVIQFCTMCTVGCAMAATYEFAGQPNAKHGWTFLPAEEGTKVYIPFEGVYESKGGRIRSPRFLLDKPAGKAGFYRLTFTAKAAVQGYWWVDFYDRTGKVLPDINSALVATEKPIRENAVLYAAGNAVSADISFVTKKGVAVRDIKLEKITPEEAAAWCDTLFSTLPKKPFQVTNDAFKRLPRTKSALNNGTPWKILMLGDSIVNDTWCSNYQALVMRDFPRANLEFLISVRGGTGVWFYKNPEKFQEYVGQFKPDLVIIGGISNVKKDVSNTPEADLIAVIQQCRAIGAEVVVTSPPLSYKWRTGKPSATWHENWTAKNGRKPYQRDYQFSATQKTLTAYWDLTTVPCRIVEDCPQESAWFSRDEVHNNDRGKQLIGQNLAAWFRMAKE